MYTEIQKKISNLTFSKQLLFGISCIKRINMRIDELLVSTKSITAMAYLNELIDKIFIECSEEHFDRISGLLSIEDSSQLEHLIPDTDEDGSNESVLLQNAAIGVAYCLDFIKECNNNYIYYCSLKAIETVDIIALAVLNVDSSELMIGTEVAIQNKLLDAIADIKDDLDGIKTFKDSILQFKMEV